MNMSSRWPRVLLIGGLVCMLVGAIDPLEGSLIVLPGIVMVALGALVGRSPRRRLVCWSCGSVAIGVGALWVISACGGIRLLPSDHAGHSMWWGLFILPYPIGWVTSMVGTILLLIESFRKPAPPVAA